MYRLIMQYSRLGCQLYDSYCATQITNYTNIIDLLPVVLVVFNPYWV